MAEISKDKREAYRYALARHLGGTVSMPRADLLSLLAVADERDRLREHIEGSIQWHAERIARELAEGRLPTLGPT